MSNSRTPYYDSHHHHVPGRGQPNVHVGSGGSGLQSSTFSEPPSNRSPPNPHANRYQEPTVGHGSHDWKLQGVFRHGAFSAVGGDQVIKAVSSSATYPVTLSPYPNANPKPNPSILPEFHHRDRRHPNAHDRGVTFGEGSFSAVSGDSRITNRNGLLVGFSTSSYVLPGQSVLPPPNSHTTNGTPFFVPGSHSAVSGYHGPGPHAPNVLMGAQNFHSQDGYFKAGSFSAVGGNQILTLEEPSRHHRHHAHPQPPTRGSHPSGSTPRH